MSQEWHYKIVPCSIAINVQERILNEEGREGWELVTVVRDGTICYLYFRRGASGIR